MNLITQDELNLLSDTKYKSYIQAIDKCVKNFESSTEWADLISSLGKLKKTLQSYPKYQYIPKRISIAKRLSQCLHPKLPSGVHLKALEVYTVIFQNIGIDNLSRDIFLYSSGLFPLLENAALSVKPILLGIYEQFFLPLKIYLKPALTGFILAVLPGLEEGSDIYQRTYDLLKNVSKQTGDDYFFTCMWSAMLFSSSETRFPAIQYILSHFDRKKTMEDQLYLIGTSIDTMINSIVNCLQDTNSLVQRSILDFILQCLPMHNNQITRDDKIKLIKIAIHLVLRRDMSLNRRLYAWFLGQDSNSNPISIPKSIQLEMKAKQTAEYESIHDESQQQPQQQQHDLFNYNIYFKLYSQTLLIQSIKSLLNKDDYFLNTIIGDDLMPNQSISIRMLKIISSLIEKQEIGQIIVEDILLDLLLYVYKECESLNNEQSTTNNANSNSLKEKNEIVKASCNFIFQSFQLSFIWEFCANKFDSACNLYNNENEKSALDNTTFTSTPSILCDLYAFILDLTNLDVYTEIQTEYLPIMLKRILITLNNNCQKISNHDLTKSFNLCLKILKKIVPKVVSNVEEDSIINSLYLFNQEDEADNDNNNSSEIVNDDNDNDDDVSYIDDYDNDNKSNDDEYEDQIDEEYEGLYDNSFTNNDSFNTLKNNEENNINVCRETLNDIIDLVELMDNTVNKAVQKAAKTSKKIKSTTISLKTKRTFNATSVDTASINTNNINLKLSNLNGKCTNIIQICVYHLKQLIHNFIHANIIDASQTTSDDINIYFLNLFHKNSIIKRLITTTTTSKPTTRSNTFNNLTLNDDTQNSLSELNIAITNDFVADQTGDQADEQLSLSESITIIEQKTQNLTTNMRIKLKKSAINYLSSFKQLNKFLIKLFLFPRALVNIQQINLIYNLQENNLNFEDWLKDLFVLSCLDTTNNFIEYNEEFLNFFEFQSVTINTLLEFLFISESFYADLKLNEEINAKNGANDRIKLLVTTVFTQKQLNLIYNQSYIGYIIGKMLWSYLGHTNEIVSIRENNNNNNNNNDLFKYHKRAATLFCLLHELLPNNLCENIISKCLINDEKSQLNTIRRFIHLWHWSKEMQNTNSAHHHHHQHQLSNTNLNLNSSTGSVRKMNKTFERCILMLLDLIDKSTAPVNKLIQEWLKKSIDDADLCRVLDILLVCLLNPNTSRVSIQFFNHILNDVHPTSVNNNSSNSSVSNNNANKYDESKIYAISHEKGNVVYHVNNDIGERLKPSAFNTNNNNNVTGSSGSNSSTSATASTSAFLLTTLPDTSRNLNLPSSISNSSLNSKSIKSAYLELPSTITNASIIPDKIGFHVNPFAGSVNENEFHDNDDDTIDDEKSIKRTMSENNFIEKYRAMKLDLEQQKQQKRVSPTTTTITTSTSARTPVNDDANTNESDINYDDYEHIVDVNENQNLNNNNNSNEENTNSSDNDTIAAGADLNDFDFIDTIDENYSFMLLYNQSYDHVRTLFVLNCLEKILKKCKNEFIYSICNLKLLNTGSSSNSINNSSSHNIQSIHNSQLIDLFIRHLKSLYGYNFYSNSSTNSNEQLFQKHLNLKNIKYIEIILIVLVFYIRSYFVQNLTRKLNKNKSSTKIVNSKATTPSTTFTPIQSSNTSISFTSIQTNQDSIATNFEQDICGNKNVKIYCLQILTQLIQELIYICQNNNNTIIISNSMQQQSTLTGAGTTATPVNDSLVQFNLYIYELLERCKLQKILLHCLYSTTNNVKQKTLTKLILNENFTNISQQTQYAFICEIINCIQNLIHLEYILTFTRNQLASILSTSTINSTANPTVNASTTKLTPSKQQQLQQQQQIQLQALQQQQQQQQQLRTANDTTSTSDNDDFLITKISSSTMKFVQTSQTSSVTIRYIQYIPIINQSMFMSSILYYLCHLNLIDFHLPILNLIRNSLPYTAQAFRSWSIYIIETLGSNLLNIVNLYEVTPLTTSTNIKSGFYTKGQQQQNQNRHSQTQLKINIPDFFVSILKQLTYLLHYSLLSNNGSYYRTSNNGGSSSNSDNESSSESQNDVNLSKPTNKQSLSDLGSYQLQAKDSLINLLPSLLSRMTHIWKAMSTSESFGVDHSAWFLGHPKAIKSHISELLAPIAVNHGISFTIAIGTVWGEKRKKTKSSIEQKYLIELIRSLRSSFPISILIKNITEIIKNSNIILKDKKKSIVNIWMLQFLHAYRESVKTNDIEYYTQLCTFFKDCMSTTNLLPAVYFQLFRILHDSVNSHSVLVDDKKYSKDIQEATHKLVDLCSNYVASSLQQTKWIGKHYAVKLNVAQNSVSSASSNHKSISTAKINDGQYVGNNSSDDNQPIDVEESFSNMSDIGMNDNESNDANKNILHSFHALNILSQYLAKTLDIVYKSDEKERLVVPVLNNLMNNIWPYLKTHVIANKDNFRVASKLLMNLSYYPYTRKTWKKEVFDMLFDSSYFYVDSNALNYWKAIIDNLISNDRTMFKDIIVKVTYPPSPGLFTSRDQEAEQKCQLLKRLAFVIYASEKDQYQKNMPEIQECVAQVLKAVQTANLYVTLFLLFRVLLLRITGKHLMALWPTVLSELIVILMQIEQDLMEELDPNKGTKTAVIESLTLPSVNLNNLVQSSTVKYNVYLSACKFLDLLFALPYSLTSQFQLYKWSFLNVNDAVETKDVKSLFIPYLVRIENLLKLKYPNHKMVQVKTTTPISGPFIKQRQIQILIELKPFFDAVTSHSFLNNVSALNSDVLKKLEQAVHEDFIENWTS